MESTTIPFAATVDLLGGVAGLLTTVAFVPQVIKAIRTRSTGDLSMGMCLTFTAGVFLWLIYGLFIGSLPIILANSVTLVLSLLMLWCKRKYG
jgi:MtN3 and saliva related transmembrane protein